VHANTKDRITDATEQAKLINYVGVARDSHIKRRINIFQTFLRPKFDFGLHLAPWQPSYADDAVEVEKMILKHPTAGSKMSWTRYRNIIGIDDLYTRRNKLGAALAARLQGHIADNAYNTPTEKWLAKLELSALMDLFTQDQLDMPDAKQKEEIYERERLVRERRCCMRDNEQPILQLPEAYARAATLWYFSRFPIHNLKHKIPSYETRKRRVQQIMRLGKWTQSERRHIISEFYIYAKYTNYYPILENELEHTLAQDAT